MQCLAVALAVAPATLTAVSTFVRRRGLWRWVRLGSLSIVMMHPLHESQTSGFGFMLADGTCAYVPLSILEAAEHWVLYSYEWLVYFLRHSCDGGEHHTPLVSLDTA